MAMSGRSCVARSAWIIAFDRRRSETRQKNGTFKTVEEQLTLNAF
jgi:hypothetical protein